jgi:hypothetical protein
MVVLAKVMLRWKCSRGHPLAPQVRLRSEEWSCGLGVELVTKMWMLISAAIDIGPSRLCAWKQTPAADLVVSGGGEGSERGA